MASRALRPIVLSAKRNSWRMLDSHADESDRRYHEVRPQVLERDDKTCGYCGFRAEKYQEVHHLDDNHGNNKLSNLVTACCLCHQCFHLGLAGVRRSGIIIWAPELEQVEINNIVRAIFVAVTNGGEHVESARNLYDSLESRYAIVEKELGTGASNPSSVGQAFLEMTPEQYETRGDRLGGLRLLAKLQCFGTQVAFWKGDTSAYGSLADSDWSRLLPQSLLPNPEDEPERSDHNSASFEDGDAERDADTEDAGELDDYSDGNTR